MDGHICMSFKKGRLLKQLPFSFDFIFLRLE